MCPKDGSLDLLPDNKYGAKFICLNDDYHFDPQNWDDEKNLDDTLEDSRIEELLQQSYLLTKSSKK